MKKNRSFCKEFFSVAVFKCKCRIYMLFLTYGDCERRNVMDFDKVLSAYRSKACIMSVDILP